MRPDFGCGRQRGRLLLVAYVQASDAPAQATEADELALKLGALLRHLLRATGRDFFAAMERHELGLTQVKALQALADAGEPISLGALSEQLGLSLPGVSRSVDGLVCRGFVKREEDPDDRRAKRLQLTAKGRRTLDTLLELRLAALRAWVETLDPAEQRALLDGLGAVAGKVGP